MSSALVWPTLAVGGEPELVGGFASADLIECLDFNDISCATSEISENIALVLTSQLYCFPLSAGLLAGAFVPVTDDIAVHLIGVVIESHFPHYGGLSGGQAIDFDNRRLRRVCNGRRVAQCQT